MTFYYVIYIFFNIFVYLYVAHKSMAIHLYNIHAGNKKQSLVRFM